MVALSTAATIKVISDAVTPTTDTTLDGAVGNTIDVALKAAAAITTEKIRIEKTTVHLDAVINGREEPIEIVQAGGNLGLKAVLVRLGDLGYRASWVSKKAGRVDGQDRVSITIAWDTT